MTLATVLASAKSAGRFVRHADVAATPPAWIGGGTYCDVATTRVITHRRWGTTTFCDLSIPLEVFANETGLIRLALALGEISESAHVQLLLDPARAPYAPPRQIAVIRTPNPDPASMTRVYKSARDTLDPLLRAPLSPEVVRELLSLRAPPAATWDQTIDPETRGPLVVSVARHADTASGCLALAAVLLASDDPPPRMSVHVALGGKATLLLGSSPDPDLPARSLRLGPPRPDVEVLAGRQDAGLIGLQPLARSPMEARK
ncbi:MAG: hypothetical protein M0T79_09750 [Actinomycetota bacterium]|nr:hypothetical protein [Actinomycetota bacterium]